jgi:hypothetical protein
LKPADADALHPLKVQLDARSRDVSVHPMPPHRGAADCGGSAKSFASVSAFSSTPRAMVPVPNGTDSEVWNRQRLLELGFKCNAHLPQRVHRLPPRDSIDGAERKEGNHTGRREGRASEQGYRLVILT